MRTRTDTRRIAIFLGFAFGISWLTALIISLTGGLANSRPTQPGLSLAVVLFATGYMWAPALGNILTRLATHEGWNNLWIRPNFQKGWFFWAAAWFLPAILTLAGAALFFWLFPLFFDHTLYYVRSLLATSPALSRLSTPAALSLQLFLAVLVAPILNALATFGEEFGWRAYLLPKLMPLGGRTAVLLTGLIWGVWHWPVILMGYEYGHGYPGFPWTGMLLFLWVTLCFATFLVWVTLRGNSVWPAVIGHGAINGIAGVALLTTFGHPSTLLGPLPVGLIGSLGYALAAALIFFSPRALDP